GVAEDVGADADADRHGWRLLLRLQTGQRAEQPHTGTRQADAVRGRLVPVETEHAFMRIKAARDRRQLANEGVDADVTGSRDRDGNAGERRLAARAGLLESDQPCLPVRADGDDLLERAARTRPPREGKRAADRP